MDKKKAIKLKVDEELHFSVIGISSHENDYRLVWAMNNEMPFNFSRDENLVVFNAKLKSDLAFSRYKFADEEKYLIWYLVANRCEDGYLFPEIKNLDYILQISGEISLKETEEVVKNLKKVSLVSAAFAIDPSKLKDAFSKLIY